MTDTSNTTRKNLQKLPSQESKRSLAQNRLYWMWTNSLAKIAKMEPERIHRALCIKYLYAVDCFGNNLGRYDSTTALTVSGFHDYLNAVQVFAAELDIQLPSPDDLYWEALGYETKRKTSL